MAPPTGPSSTLNLNNTLMVCAIHHFLVFPEAYRGSLQSKFKPAKIYKDAIEAAPPKSPGAGPSRGFSGPRHITGLSFDDRGDQVVTAAEDETFRLYNCKTGKRVSSMTRATHT
jgi:WD40 repeat protein